MTVRLDDTLALDDVDVRLEPGRVLAVLGPSGSGKSTLLRAVAGLQPTEAGRVRWDGQDLAGVPVHRRGFALMFQDGQLFAHRTVGDNVAYALPRRDRGSASGRTRVGELLELVGLPGYAARRPATLSGGEQQRVALARALAARPRLLLLDEPLSSLDAALRTRLAVDLRRILTDAAATAVAVTHDHAEAFALADEVALLRDGAVAQRGEPAEVWRAPVSVEVARFLGFDRVLEGAAATGVRAAGAGPADERPLAVRPGVLALDPAGEVRGRVVGVRPAPEQVVVELEVEGWGRLGAYADTAPQIGETVTSRVDLSRTAPVGPR
ncbi:ABC transporter ATP-binding protein [Nocardioidaceae bacterium]|nr:ABC transporter ATP-binding protein [Nocardioidaceae bacterium]